MSHRLVLVLGALLAASGCASSPPLPTYPGATPDDALAVFSRHHDGWRTLAAEVAGDAEKGSFSGVLFVDRAAPSGGRFRLYAWKFGGSVPVFDLLVEARRLRLYVPQAARLLDRPLDETPSHPMEALLLALLRDARALERRAVRAREGFRIEETAGGRFVSVWTLDPGTLAPLRETVYDGSGRPALEIALSDHTVASGRVVPRRLDVRRPGEPEAKAFRLELHDVRLDAPLDERKFAMRIPPGTKVVREFRELEEER